MSVVFVKIINLGILWKKQHGKGSTKVRYGVPGSSQNKPTWRLVHLEEEAPAQAGLKTL